MVLFDQLAFLIRKHKPFGISDEAQTHTLADLLTRVNLPEKVNLLQVRADGTVDICTGYLLEAVKETIVEQAAEVVAGIPLEGGSSLMTDQFALESLKALEWKQETLDPSWIYLYPEASYVFPNAAA